MDRYEALFPKRQQLMLKSEDLFADTTRMWENIQRFLKLLPIQLPRADASIGKATMFVRSL